MQIKKVFRQERKFLISGEQYYRFSRQFAELFKEDSHNGKDGYMVRSLYFDTLGNKDFEEKLAGVECRRIMRLRIYSPQSRTALLEMKQKQGSNQLKRSLTISSCLLYTSDMKRMEQRCWHIWKKSFSIMYNLQKKRSLTELCWI